MLHFPNAAVLPSHTAEIEPERVLERICVRPPYFALSELRLEGNVFEAVARAELPQGREVGPMQGAELSRHTAIAGLCAAALAQDDAERRYYLARQGEYEIYANAAPYGTPVALRAELLELSKREARAEVVATALGMPLAKLDVRYTVLTEAAFERLFRARRQANPPRATMGTLPAGRMAWEGDALVRTVEGVPVEACAGHFEQHPAMPVAVLMGQLGGLAMDALPDAVSPVRFVRASVTAQDLCWAGEQVRLAVSPAPAVAGREGFECSAHAEGRLAATMSLTLERLGSLA